MSCVGCCLAPQRDQDKPLIIDVEQAIADAAWENFLGSYGKFRKRFLKRKNFKIEVPMNYYHFEQIGPQVFKTKPRSSSAAHAVVDPDSSNKSRLEGRQLAHSDQTSPEHIGLETIFNNDTDKEQTYNFKFDKTRKASVSVTYQRGYSFGGKANFSLGLPKVLTDSSLGVDFNASVQVTKSSGEVFEESITTSANSQITVGSHSHYTASVVMQERNLLAEFELNMQMSMPAKRAPVYIRAKSTGEQVYAYSVCSLAEVFETYPDVRWVKDDVGNIKSDAVIFHIEGLVNGMQLSSHVINLSGRSLLPGNGKGGASGTGGTSGEGDGTDGGEGEKTQS